MANSLKTFAALVLIFGVSATAAAECPTRLPPFDSRVVQNWLDCVADAERVLRQQPEPADVVVTATFGACAEPEAAVAAAAGGYECGLIEGAREIVRRHLLADIMARRAALDRLNAQKLDRRSWNTAPPVVRPAVSIGDQITANEMALLREQLQHCWEVPAEARDAKGLVIAVRVSMGPDGRARQAVIVDQGRLGDPIFRAAAESARLAFFHPDCYPLRILPAGKYELWKDLVVNFEPAAS
jgi:hypothetical protein